VLEIVTPDAKSVMQLLPLGFTERTHLRARYRDSLVHLIHLAPNHFRLDDFDDKIFNVLGGELQMDLDLGERNDFGIARRHGHEGEDAHLVDVVFVTQAEDVTKSELAAWNSR